MPFEIPPTSVDQDDDEKDGVEVWNDGSWTDNSTPHETHDPVGHVVLQKNRW